MKAVGYHTRRKKPHPRREDQGIDSAKQPGVNFSPSTAELRTKEATRADTPLVPTLGPRGGAKRAGEGRLDAGEARSDVSTQGNHLQAAAAGIAPKGRGRPQDSDPSPAKPSPGGAETGGECY